MNRLDYDAGSERTRPTSAGSGRTGPTSAGSGRTGPTSAGFGRTGPTSAGFGRIRPTVPRPALAILALIALFIASSAAAQSRDANSSATRTGPAGAVELIAGYAGFVDDATVDHSVIGGAARVYASPRLSLGPEVLYMRGPGFDRDLFVTGNVTFDVIGRYGRRPRVIPFLVAGAGVMRHSDRFGTATFKSSEGAFTAGGGVRALVTDRVLVGGDARCGWELHCRVAAVVGVAFGR